MEARVFVLINARWRWPAFEGLHMHFDVELLARLQFALTIMFHYLFPPLSIGLGTLMVFMEGKYLRTRDPVYHQMTRFWSRIFAVNFAMGVATGIVMEFQFGTNWATTTPRCSPAPI